MRYLARFIATVVIAGGGLAVAALLVAPQALAIFTANHGKASGINLDPLPTRSLVYDRNGNLLATLHAEENRSPVTLDQVPANVKEAILAVEDEQFYQHKGVDLKGTLRAFFTNASSGSIQQGGSTITMQVVKNSLLSPERNLKRKVKEAVLANRLEAQMSKDQILERYLNTVYFGNSAYGVQAAAETYFGKNVGDLTWPESALLASLIRDPRDYDPFKNPKLALERRHIALQRLVETSHLSQQEADLYDFVPLPTAPHELLPPPKDYFLEEVKQQLLRDPTLGATYAERYNAVFKGGLKIYTTFDPTMQLEATAARNRTLPGPGNGLSDVPPGRDFVVTTDPNWQPPPNRPNLTACQPGPAGGCRASAAVVSVEPGTGAVRAMVGGPGFDQYKFNLATAANRQPGSSMKTFVLVTLLENGYVPNDTVDGAAPCKIPNPGGTPNPYIANNAEGSEGVGTITSQTAGSVNCAFLRLGQVVGLDKVVAQAKKMGVTSPLIAIPSLPLGTIGISPLEMAGAYASIANGGIYNPPYYVDKVLDASGKVVIEHKPAGQRVMSDETARLATQVLQQVVLGGTGTRAKIPGRQVAGKTGTAQDETDAWFVGFTPQLSTAVWMGALDGKVPMFNVGGVKVFGGTYPARIWQAYMAQALNGQPVINFPKADGTRAGKYLHIKEEPDKPTATTRRRGPSPAPTATTTLSSTPPSDKGGKGGGGGDGHGHPTTTVGTGGGPPPTT